LYFILKKKNRKGNKETNIKIKIFHSKKKRRKTMIYVSELTGGNITQGRKKKGEAYCVKRRIVSNLWHLIFILHRSFVRSFVRSNDSATAQQTFLLPLPTRGVRKRLCKCHGAYREEGEAARV
jgi:hypothetical protein